MESIVSVRNPRIKDVCALHRRKGREEQGRYLIEGRHLLAEALKWRMPIETIYYTGTYAGEGQTERSALVAQAAAAGAGLIEVSESVMDKIATTEAPQGVAAVLRRPEGSRSFAGRGEGGIILLLDRIQDPGNLGSILRVALAAGVRNILLTPGSADPYGPKALRGGMGSHFGLNVQTEAAVPECIALCARGDAYVMALTAGGRSLYDEEDRCGGLDGADGADGLVPKGTAGRSSLVLILGNEGRGIAPELLEWADEHRSLPMCHGVESLNVAVTAGIALYEIKRRRRAWRNAQL